MHLCEDRSQLHRGGGRSYRFRRWEFVILTCVTWCEHCKEVIRLANICRWSFGVWEFGVQYLRVCPHAAGKQQVQDHGEESPAGAHLLRHSVHADHRGPGEQGSALSSPRPQGAHVFLDSLPSLNTLSFFPQIKAWTANPQQFVEDEDDDTFSYSVRISAQDLLLVRWKPFVWNDLGL